MESKIYQLEGDLEDSYSNFVIERCEGNFNKIKYMFKDVPDFEYFYDILLDGCGIGVEFKDDKIYPRAYLEGKKLNFIKYDREGIFSDLRYFNLYVNKNVLTPFDDRTVLDLSKSEEDLPPFMTPEYVKELQQLRFVDIHLNKNDALRGTASIMDTGLFDFKSTH